MYTIKQASTRTGLAIPTIRVWERRYGVVQPRRTPAGYRLYDDAAIERLVAMRHLVEDEGWRPSQAAERVRDAGDDLSTLLPDRPAGSGPAGEPSAASAEPSADAIDPDAVVRSYVSAARTFDVPVMERLLDDAFAARRFERAMDEVVFPTLRALGAAWGEDDLDVAQEHVASDAVRRRLARFYDAAARSGSTSQVVVGMPPAGQHELGALSFAVAGRRAGLDILYLGSSVPMASWLQTMRETRARIAVIGVVTRADAADAARVVERLRTLPAPPLCLIGGPARHDVPAGPGVVHLPDGTDDAVALTVALVVDGPAAP